jgi:putative peptidoglycan lipid II flippase
MVTITKKWVQLWSVWTDKSVNRRILAGAVTVGGLTLVVNGAIFAKELATAYLFGTVSDLDAFVMAYMLPFVISSVLAKSFGNAFMPEYVKVREHQDVEATRDLFQRALGSSLSILIFSAVVLGIAAYPLLHLLSSTFGPEKLALTVSLTHVMLPMLVFGGYSATAGALLNASGRFGLVAIAPAATPLLVLAALASVGRTAGVYALAYGTTAGFALEAVLLAFSLRRHGFPVLPKWPARDTSLRLIHGQYLPVVGGALLLSGSSLVDQSFASILMPGSVTSLSYGLKLISFVITIGATGVGTAILPHFCQMVATGDVGTIRHTLKKYSLLLLAICIPLTGVLIFFSEPIVSLIFQRGAFTAADSRLVASIQRCYLLQLPAYLINMLITRLITSLRANHIILCAAVFSFALNIILDYFFAKWLGVQGIAIATSVVLTVTTVLLALAVPFLLRSEPLVLKKQVGRI